MRKSRGVFVLILLLAVPSSFAASSAAASWDSVAAPSAVASRDSVGAPSSLADVVSTPAQEPGRGDDLARIKAWRSFLDRASRAFFAARMNTEAVQAKITEADARIEALEAAAKSSDPDPGGRSDITGDVAFLERAFRAFTAARMNTADVQKWLNEAKDKS